MSGTAHDTAPAGGRAESDAAQASVDEALSLTQEALSGGHSDDTVCMLLLVSATRIKLLESRRGRRGANERRNKQIDAYYERVRARDVQAASA